MHFWVLLTMMKSRPNEMSKAKGGKCIKPNLIVKQFYHCAFTYSRSSSLNDQPIDDEEPKQSTNLWMQQLGILQILPNDQAF